MFELTQDGLELIEVAPGIDIERDILARMDFRPIMRRDPAIMDARIFSARAYGIARRHAAYPASIAALPIIRSRTSSSSILKVTWFEPTRTSNGYASIVEGLLSPLGRKVYVIVNYDHFTINPDVVDEYSAMVGDLVDRFYSGVTRYTTSSFLRAKLGDALKQRSVAPHIYESANEARAYLRELERQVTG